MNLLVKKFGGTSVGSPEKIKAVAKRLSSDAKKGLQQVVVVSAMGDTTDYLVSLAREIHPNPSPREYDALVSTGENVSASLLSMALQAIGIDAISLTGPQAGIKTESLYSKAKIIDVEPSRIIRELGENKVVIVTGFQGLNDNNDITTIGRGGSDTSAVVLAAALGCDVCEIYTDVDGIYTTDPRVVTDAKKLDEISYDEMLELASLGAKVLHPRAVECAKENGIVLHVRSSFDPSEGTYVKEANTMEVNKPVTGATVMEAEALVSVVDVKDSPGVAAILFSKLAEHAINIDMIIQSAEEGQVNNITFTVPQEDLEKAREVTQKVADELGAKAVKTDDSIAKVSIVGVGMISKPGVAAQMFKALGENKINIKLISTSEIKISCAIDQKDAKKAVQVLHKTFELDKI